MYSEHGENMNTAVGKSLLRAGIATLRQIGLNATVNSREARSDKAGDATLTLERDGTHLQYQVEIKRAVGPELVGHIALAFAGHTEDRLLITAYVTAPLAQEFRRRGIQFVDAVGNAFLKRQGLLVFVTSYRPRARPTARRTPRVFRPSGLRMTFALLSLPDLTRASQRDIARAARVALGSVADIFRGLRELGFIAEIHGKRQLLHRERLLNQWTEAYARTLGPSLEIARFSAPSPTWWRDLDLTPYNAQWGGETAAAILQGNIIPEGTILYAADVPRSLLSKYRFKADPDGRVIVRRRFWNFETPESRREVVPPLLVYADLVAAGDARSVAAAEQIRSGYLV